MVNYKLNVRSDNFKKSYNIMANDLNEASKKAKVKFIKEFKEFNVKVGLDTEDLPNHINEIFEKIMTN